MNHPGIDTFDVLFGAALFMALVSAMPSPAARRSMAAGDFFYTWLWSFLQTACVNISHLNPSLGALSARTESTSTDGHGKTERQVTETVAVAIPNAATPQKEAAA